LIKTEFSFFRFFFDFPNNISVRRQFYRAFNGFGQTIFAYNGSILGLSQFAPLSQNPLKMTLDLKVVKIDFKI